MMISKAMTDMAMAMACSNIGSKKDVLLILVLLILSQPISGGCEELKEEMIGSRPPKCVNKCLNCRPCVAALVISQRHKEANEYEETQVKATAKDDQYYLLSWKCKCNDKYFQP